MAAADSRTEMAFPPSCDPVRAATVMVRLLRPIPAGVNWKRLELTFGLPYFASKRLSIPAGVKVPSTDFDSDWASIPARCAKAGMNKDEAMIEPAASSEAAKAAYLLRSDPVFAISLVFRLR